NDGSTLHSYFASITSVDLMMAVTVSPSARPRSSALRRVTTDTISLSPIAITVSAITPPSRTDLTVPASWLRAVSFTSSSFDRSGQDATGPTSNAALSRRGCGRSREPWPREESNLRTQIRSLPTLKEDLAQGLRLRDS